MGYIIYFQDKYNIWKYIGKGKNDELNTLDYEPVINQPEAFTFSTEEQAREVAERLFKIFNMIDYVIA